MSKQKQLEKDFNYLSWCPIYRCVQGFYFKWNKTEKKWDRTVIIVDVDNTKPQLKIGLKDTQKKYYVYNERCNGEWHLYNKVVQVDNKETILENFASPCPAFKQFNKLLGE